MLQTWRSRYQHAQEASEQLKSLEERSQSGPLPLNDKWRRACLTEEFGETTAALPLYQEVLSADANHAGANFAVGRLKIESMEEGGIDLIEQAMKFDHQYVIPGCELLYQFLLDRGREQEARKYVDQARSQTELYEMAQKERAGIRLNDRFIPHNLSEEALVQLRDQLTRYPEIDKAHLACKAVEILPQVPLYVLCFTIKVPWYRYRSEKSNLRLVQRMAEEMEFPGEFFVIYAGSNKRLSRKIQKIPGSIIHRRA
jgi:hypothetical protein